MTHIRPTSRSLFALGCLLALAACGGVTDHADLDGDGYCVAPGTVWSDKDHRCEGDRGFGDCDDNAATTSPAAEELCDDGLDNDCDGQIDEEIRVDEDGDGFTASTCPRPGDDCNDNDASISPRSEEICDGIDNNCNDSIDEALAPVAQWPDRDGDGFGTQVDPQIIDCRLREGHTEAGSDCDDSDDAIFPNAPERCNLADDDCDGTIDEETAPRALFAEDVDGDGFGTLEIAPIMGCSLAVVPGWSSDIRDCNDDDPEIRPERVDDDCDGVDDNCSGRADDDSPIYVYWLDADADGFGVGPPMETCADQPPPGWAVLSGDCDDAEPLAYPHTTQDLCDGIDADCDDNTDEDARFTNYFIDGDSDGWGDAAVSTCDGPPPGTVLRAGDCDDASAAVSPEAIEIACDDTDQDCTGADLCAEAFWVAGSRATSNLHLGPPLDPFETTCAVTQRTWISERAGFEGSSTYNQAIQAMTGTRLHLAWEVGGTTSVEIPALSLVELPPSGTLDVTVPANAATLELVSEGGILLGSVDLQVTDPSPEPPWRPQCYVVAQPDGMFPRNGGRPAVQAPVAACAAYPINDTSPIDQTSCCRDRQDHRDAWVVSDTRLTFTPDTAPELGTRVHRVYGHSTVMSIDSEISLSWDVPSFEGDLWYRVGLLWDVPSDNVCDLGARPSSASSWLVSNNLNHWDFGAGHTLPGMFPAQTIGLPDTGTRVTPYVEVYLPDPVDLSAALSIDNMTLSCCGAECNTCTDFDLDSRGPWCPQGIWDCSDGDANAYPGATGALFDCASPTWWDHLCLTDGFPASSNFRALP